MSKCLMLLMHLHIMVSKYPHFIDVLNVRNNGSMNNVLGKLKWVLLLTCIFNVKGWYGLCCCCILWKTLAFLVSLQKELSYSSVM